MGLQTVKKTGTVYDPVWISILDDIPGGGSVKTNRIPAGVKQLLAGTLLQEDGTTGGLYNPIKSAKSDGTQATATSNTFVQTDPDKLLFIAGDFVSLEGKTTGATIVSVTQTSATQVTIVTDDILGTLATATILVQTSSSSGGTGKLYTADSILKETIRVREDDGTTIDNIGGGIVTRGMIDESEMPYPVEAADKTGLTARIHFV